MLDAAIMVGFVLIAYALLYDLVHRAIAAYFHHKFEYTKKLMGFGHGDENTPSE